MKEKQKGPKEAIYSKVFIDRFWTHVDKTDVCWIWTGSRKEKGYGRVNHNGINRLAHRVSFEIEYNRALLRNEHVLHLCHNASCVKPSHLMTGCPSLNRKQDRAPERAGLNQKLTEAEVVEIVTLLREGNLSQKAIGDLYGVSHSHISGIKRGRKWGHLCI